MRKRKPDGGHKPHPANECGVCAKPRTHRDATRIREIETAERMSAQCSCPKTLPIVVGIWTARYRDLECPIHGGAF